LHTFLLDAFELSSSALRFVPVFVIVFDFFIFGSSVTGCDEIRVERLGADSCPSATTALRGIAVICDGSGFEIKVYTVSRLEIGM
jgi:hypothetical protein